MKRLIFAAWVALLAGMGAAQAQSVGQCPTQSSSVSGSSYTLKSTDNCLWVFLTNSGPITVTLPAASLVFSPGGYETVLYPLNDGTVTLVAQADANRGLARYVNGVTSLTVAAGQPISLRIGQDSNWYAVASLLTTIVNPTITGGTITNSAINGGTIANLSAPLPGGSGGTASTSLGPEFTSTGGSGSRFDIASGGVTSSMLASGAAAANLGSGTANQIYATPNGASGMGSFRALVSADLPSALTPATVTTTGASGIGNIKISGAGGSWFWIDNPTSSTLRISSGATPGTNPLTYDSSGQLNVASLNTTGGVSGTTAPHLATNALLAAASTAAYPNGVWRDDYSASFGAQPLFYTPSGSACSLNAGNGDNGSQVKSADGKCWLASLPLEPSVLEWGAPYGGTDAEPAILACLNAVGAGGTCRADGHRFTLLTSLTMPGHTTIKGGDTFPDSENTPSAWNTLPALILGSGISITAGGASDAIKNVLVIPAGKTFPLSGPAAFASGTALLDGGNDNFQVIDSIIIGFDSSIYNTGAREYFVHDYLDGIGSTHAVLDLNAGNTDSGYVHDVKIQPLATGNGNCTNSVRPGTGFRVDGGGLNGSFIDGIVSQNFQTAQFDFEASVELGTIWADNINGTGAGCGASGYGNSIGVKLGPGAPVSANAVYISFQNTGILSISNGSVSRFNYLSVASTGVNSTPSGGDAIDLGDSTHSGNLHIGTYAASANAGYAANFLHNNGELKISHADVVSENGSAAPYFNSTASATIGKYNANLVIGSLTSDLSAGSNPFGGFTYGYGSDDILGNLSAPTPSACGTSPSTVGTQDRGFVTTGSGTVTACTLTWPASFAASPGGVVNCVFQNISNNTLISLSGLTATAMTLNFSASFPSGQVFYRCAH